jgi:hypothetical protein
MRFLQPHLRKTDRAYHQNLSAQLSGISVIVTDAFGGSIPTIRAKHQYIAIAHG